MYIHNFLPHPPEDHSNQRHRVEVHVHLGFLRALILHMTARPQACMYYMHLHVYINIYIYIYIYIYPAEECIYIYTGNLGNDINNLHRAKYGKHSCTCIYTCMYMYMRISKNHNSLGREQPLGLDVNQSPAAQDAFWPIPGLISCVHM